MWFGKLDTNLYSLSFCVCFYLTICADLYILVHQTVHKTVEVSKSYHIIKSRGLRLL